LVKFTGDKLFIVYEFILGRWQRLCFNAHAGYSGEITFMTLKNIYIFYCPNSIRLHMW